MGIRSCLQVIIVNNDPIQPQIKRLKKGGCMIIKTSEINQPINKAAKLRVKNLKHFESSDILFLFAIRRI
jgi:hypothetical protein